jgi:hypothetical protein
VTRMFARYASTAARHAGRISSRGNDRGADVS